MYTTCLFCNTDLGRNESIASFPVGRRLAFDASKGRLWVVCPKCERWNLTPLEERWEAIECAQELYGSTRIRAATDNIGMARLRGGMELVRIGEPMRPEFAGWRYGDQFGRRRRRQILIAGAGVTAVGAIVVGGLAAGAGIGGFGWGLVQLGRAAVRGNPDTVVAKIKTSTHGTVRVRRRHLAETRLMRGDHGPLAIDLRFVKGQAHFDGPEATRIAGILIPKVNRFGAPPDAVQEAVSRIDESHGSEGFLDRLSRVAHVTTAPSGKKKSKWSGEHDMTKGLFGLPKIDRLALEMALHEEAERRAIEGELATLERAWREAEEIAAIADDLLVPSGVRGMLDRLRR
jgi:hypothetical protein